MLAELIPRTIVYESGLLVDALFLWMYFVVMAIVSGLVAFGELC